MQLLAAYNHIAATQKSRVSDLYILTSHRAACIFSLFSLNPRLNSGTISPSRSVAYISDFSRFMTRRISSAGLRGLMETALSRILISPLRAHVLRRIYLRQEKNWLWFTSISIHTACIFSRDYERYQTHALSYILRQCICVIYINFALRAINQAREMRGCDRRGQQCELSLSLFRISRGSKGAANRKGRVSFDKPLSANSSHVHTTSIRGRERIEILTSMGNKSDSLR